MLFCFASRLAPSRFQIVLEKPYSNIIFYQISFFFLLSETK